MTVCKQKSLVLVYITMLIVILLASCGCSNKSVKEDHTALESADNPSITTDDSIASTTEEHDGLSINQPAIPIDEINDKSVQTISPIDETIIIETVRNLCATPRKWGTDGEKRAGVYIVNTMKGYGYEPVEQKFPVYKTGIKSFYANFFDMNPEQSGALGYGCNIIFTKHASIDTNKTLVVSAHYDSVSDCLSAVDNASGVAAVMEAARILSNYELPFKLIFIFFSAEEYYITGSRNYALQLSEHERKNILGCINVDMVGESGGGNLELRTAEGHNVLTLLHVPNEIIEISRGGTSDDASFAKINIPTITIAQKKPNYELQKLESDLDFFDPEGCIEAPQLIVDFMVSYDISTHEQLLNELPIEDLNISAPYFNDPWFIFKFSEGSLLEYKITDTYQKLLPNGVASEYVCEYTNNQGKSYSISQTLYAAPKVDISTYGKVVLNEDSFGTYYLSSDEMRTILVCPDGSFLLKIDGQITEDEAVKIFLNMKLE